MPHHFTKGTVQASIWCGKCCSMTPWRIADGRRQYCIPCYERREAQRVAARATTTLEEQGISGTCPQCGRLFCEHRLDDRQMDLFESEE